VYTLKPRRRATTTLHYLVLLLLISNSLATQAEPRQVFTPDSPVWLQAVGQLTVPGQRYEAGESAHYREDCSATLIGAQTILTAWHCLEYYRDMSHDIVFRLPYSTGQQSRLAHRLADGGGMSDDWAVLQLNRPIVDITPVPVRMEFIADTDSRISIAGYSRDEGLGQRGNMLTWQATCAVTENEWYRVATNCLAYKGASGGPALVEGAIVGVISAGDGQGRTYYVPSSSFRSAVRLHRR
jgi:V8-like Glu-specific endopeptidase